MQRLKDKIEKWFGSGIEYKGYSFDFLHQDRGCIVIGHKSENGYKDGAELSINDLCSPECSFFDSLEFKQTYYYIGNQKSLEQWCFNPDIVGCTARTVYGSNEVEYHRMQLSLLSDEEKILYLINNTK